jgi:hypothetical protein
MNESLRKILESAAATVLKTANQHYGTSFEKWEALCDFIRTEHPEDALEFEYSRIDEVVKLLSEEGNSPEDCEVLRNALRKQAENGFQDYCESLEPYHQEPSEILDSDKRMLEYLRQLEDPESPLRKGSVAWRDYSKGVEAAFKSFSKTPPNAPRGCLILLIVNLSVLAGMALA